MSYHHLTQEQIREILETYKETQSTRVTAERLGLKLGRVQYHVRRAGLPLTHRGNNACARDHDLVTSLAARGTSLSEIARRVGTNKRHVKRYMVEHDIEIVPFDQSGCHNPNWRGGRVVDCDGYILVHRPDHPNCDRHGYVREHRLAMEQKLGRYLTSSEVVHHLDGDKANNDIENLELYGSNAAHLAASLSGKVPQWSEDGLRRMRAGIARSVETRRRSSHDQ